MHGHNVLQMSRSDPWRPAELNADPPYYQQAADAQGLVDWAAIDLIFPASHFTRRQIRPRLKALWNHCQAITSGAYAA